MKNFAKQLETPTTIRINARASYAHLFKPRAAQEGQEPKYSCTLLVDKDDAKAVELIDKAVASAKALYKEQYGKALSPRAKSVVYDGDIDFADDENCENKIVIRTSNKRQPLLKIRMDDGSQVDPLDETEIKSGDYIAAVIRFYPYDNSSATGISANLEGVIKIEDGPALGGSVMTADTAFGDMD